MIFSPGVDKGEGGAYKYSFLQEGEKCPVVKTDSPGG
jgi:hypothetical protein